MLKRELIPIVLLLQNKITEDNNVMLQEMRKFNENFAKLQAELVVTKRVLWQWNVSAGPMPSTQGENV